MGKNYWICVNCNEKNPPKKKKCKNCGAPKEG